MKIYSSALVIATGLMMHACFYNEEQTVVGTGEVDSMEVEVGPFTGVSVTGRCDVEITAGEEQFLELFAQGEILDVMTFRVRNGVLTIGFENGINVETSKEIRAVIRVPAIDYIGLTGAGDFDLTGEKQDRLDIDIMGAGNIGAYGLETDHATIHLSGAGNCRVLVNETLDVHISGVGNVYYRGDPEITSNISGIGNVMDDND